MRTTWFFGSWEKSWNGKSFVSKDGSKKKRVFPAKSDRNGYFPQAQFDFSFARLLSCCFVVVL